MRRNLPTLGNVHEYAHRFSAALQAYDQEARAGPYLFDDERMQNGSLEMRHAILYLDLTGLSDSDLRRLILDKMLPLEFAHTLTDQIGRARARPCFAYRRDTSNAGCAFCLRRLLCSRQDRIKPFRAKRKSHFPILGWPVALNRRDTTGNPRLHAFATQAGALSSCFTHSTRN